MLATVTAGTAFPLVAHAQQTAPAGNGCPPGSWFCAETTAPPAPPPPPPPPPSGGAGTGPGVTLSTEPPPPPPPPPYTYGGPSRPPPPVVIYQPGPRIVAPVSRPPMYLYTPRPRPRPEWGLNLHFQGGPLKSKYDSVGAHMEGGGAGLRFRPVPVYALEADLDFYGGRDYNDFTRSETAFTINNYFFVNPHDKLQLYLLAGMGWSVASAFDDNRSAATFNTYHYDYFGAFGGIGLEWRLGKHVALNGDARGFIRGRIDDHDGSDPEFVSSTGQTSNTSAGVLFTGGLTFYF